MVVIDLLLGLLLVQKFLRKHHRDGNFYHRVAISVVPGNFAPHFSLKFLSTFVHISGSMPQESMVSSQVPQESMG